MCLNVRFPEFFLSWDCLFSLGGNQVSSTIVLTSVSEPGQISSCLIILNRGISYLDKRVRNGEVGLLTI